MSDLVARYQANYALTEPITEEQVQRHLELERDLTRQLMASTPETRRETFVRCYDELYRELSWLTATGHTEEDAGDWPYLLGPAPQRVYEVGSGAGGLARALARLGYEVEATDITMERGRREEDGVLWTETDGVHLERTAAHPPYDAVLSNQVIEHLHPDDIVAHFMSARAILRAGGRYVVNTPLRYEGPADISRVFALPEPVGMHLREYTHRELTRAARAGGFDRVLVPFGLPHALRARLGLPLRPNAGYARYVRAVESLLDRLPAVRRRQLARALKVPLFTRTLTLVCERTR